MAGRHLFVVTALLAALLATAALRLRGPAPLPATAPAGQFSAYRAFAVLSEVLKDIGPHPVGTPANQLVRDRIASRFRELGFVPAIHRHFVCNATPTCATVANLFVVRAGDAGPWVVLVAHYDSVAAGPGASDDGAGVAVLLEIARALQGTSGIAYLVTDGEEAGLLGAEAFVTSPLKDRVRAVINVENRGTSGPSFLFETSRGNSALLPAIRAIERPAASSLFYTIYELLPNDTDVTVFKRAGLAALNFAAIGDVAYYHTPLDDLAHVDLNTLQHHGDNALATARALRHGPAARRENAVFFDVLNISLISWPERWTLWIALISLALLFVAARGESWRALSMGAALSVVAFLITALLAFALVWIAYLRAGSYGRIVFPQPVIGAMWLAGIAGPLLAFGLFRRKERRGMYAGVAIVWHAVSIALASSLPGTAFLFLIPAIGFSVSLLLKAGSVVPASLAGLVLFPLALFLYPALGKTSLIPSAVVAALVASTVIPLLEHRSWNVIVAIVVLAVVAAGVTPLLPVFTKDHPRRQAIEHELPSPTVRALVERMGDITAIRVESQRDADRIAVEFDGRADVIRVNGVAPAPRNPGRSRRGAVTVYASRATIEARLSPGTGISVSDLTYGLPPEARRKAAQRDASNAVTTHRGDVTVSRMKLRVE